ncbi:hypothetical protein FA95DRAFT_1609737 [Auriscalpium vulgare]|uniref:Uncharacterized protein n=1 Tax=Auriscalpium vulgare TaxID=40419 RepID=A0ACB8RGG6_9AGAM|nr:hypothetical protein FA95DRAFT_1609737 [Auriscalpium vulgare]
MTIIPLELQIAAVEWVYRFSQHRINVDHDTLRACALVCKAWRPIAQRLLFRRVPRIYDGIFNAAQPPAATPLIDTLRAHPHLAAHVRFLYLTVSYLDPALLEVCPRIERIEMALRADYKNRPHQLAIPQRVQSVALFGENEDLTDTLKLWPGLAALEIADLFLPFTHVPSVLRIPSGVQCLYIPPHVLTRIFATAHDLPVLRDLELKDPNWSDRKWPPLLVASGLLPKLRTLVLTGPLPPARVLEQLEQLESLVFNELPVHDVSLPKTLRHVGYHCSLVPLTEDASFLLAALRALHELELVTVTRQELPVETLAAFVDACRELHVEFVTFETPSRFPRPYHVDWI